MRKSKLSETQIVGILKDARAVGRLPISCASTASARNVLQVAKQYGGASVSDVKRFGSSRPRTSS